MRRGPPNVGSVGAPGGEKDPVEGTLEHQQAMYPGPGFSWHPVPDRRDVPPARPARTHRWGLGAYVVVQGVFLLASGLMGVFVFDPDRPTVATATTAVLITKWRGNGPGEDLRWRWSWRDAGIGLAFGLGGLILTIVASMVYISIMGPDVTSAVGEVFGGLRSGVPAALTVWVVVVIIAPLCEEIVYRGLLWGALEKYGVNRWAVFAITTVVFAVAHLELTRMPLLVVISVPLGLARLYTGRLLPSVVAHQVNNVLPGIALVLGLLGVVQL